MAGLVPFNFNPVSTKKSGFDDFYNMLDDFFADPWLNSRRSLARDTFKIDVMEDEAGYVIEAEMPGVKREEIKLDITEGKLTIATMKEENTEQEQEKYIHKERRVCGMSRSIYLKDADEAGIKATLKDGVLRLNVPKIEKAVKSLEIDIE
ncbi:MAG: heat-shock protein Hsp20 [delta proteobacterium ML8_F1]|nr:MAG: heat-shock protein Hsp20 [delta proteobacterium ML8_F1]